MQGQSSPTGIITKMLRADFFFFFSKYFMTLRVIYYLYCSSSLRCSRHQIHNIKNSLSVSLNMCYMAFE